jgi:hypothetical protein
MVKRLLFCISFLLLSVLSFTQTIEFTNETEFQDALDGRIPLHETYEDCPVFDNFEIIDGDPKCNINCSRGDDKTLYMGTQGILTMRFSQPVNAFGTYFNGAGSVGQITVTFRTDDNDSYIIFMNSENQLNCNEQFTGVVSNMVFRSVTFEWTNKNDEIFLEDTYLAFLPGRIIPTLSHWGIVILSFLLIILSIVTIRNKNSKIYYYPKK